MEDVSPAHEPLVTINRALGAKVLATLLEADSSTDVLSSGYARRNLMETHCSLESGVRHPADTFFMPPIQETLRTLIK
jgi:hypothetical protein